MRLTVRIRKYSGKDGIAAEAEFTGNYLFASSLLQYVAALSPDISWFIDECIENEDGTYFAVFRSFDSPEYRDYLLSIKVEPNDPPSLWHFSVQKQIPTSG